MNKQWIVFWHNNLRLGSVELNESNLNESKKLMYMHLIQRDMTGTEHYEVSGLIKGGKIDKIRN